MLLFENYIKGGAADVYRLRLHRQGGRHSICDRRRSDRSQRRQLVLGHCLMHVRPQNKKHLTCIIANPVSYCNPISIVQL